MGRVNAIDPGRRTLTASTLAGEFTLHFEHVVLAFGNRARLDLIPGLALHALPAEDHRRCACTSATWCCGASRRSSSRATPRCVAGSATSSSSAAGSPASRRQASSRIVSPSILRYYPRVAKDELKVTLLQDLPRLLPELSERLGRARRTDRSRLAASTCAPARGLRASARAAVALAGGEMLHAATTICTIGTRPNALVERMTIPVERGRIVVDADLSVQDTPGLWAIGDCALVRNARDGKFAPPTAQFAVREARHLAGNLLAVLAGAPTRAFDYRARGSMAAIGHRKGVADICGVPLWGLPAWLLWRAYYLSQMPTLGRKVRIFVEWTWGMFFPIDITHLRFTRSHEIEAVAERDAPAARPAELKVA